MSITNIPNVIELFKMFKKINADCAASGESVVPFSDVDYYSGQIQNIYNLADTVCDTMALSMYNYARNKNIQESIVCEGHKITKSYMEDLIADNNREYHTKFSLGGAYGAYELWAKMPSGGDSRLTSGSIKDVYNTFVAYRFKEKYRFQVEEGVAIGHEPSDNVAIGINEGSQPGSYWGNEGKYEAEYKELYRNHVKSKGRSESLRGELLRCVSKLYYDLYNNGGCNVDYRDRSSFYGQMIKLVSTYLKIPQYAIDAVFRDGDDSEGILDDMIDKAIEYIQTNPDQPIPNWYSNE